MCEILQNLQLNSCAKHTEPSGSAAGGRAVTAALWHLAEAKVTARGQGGRGEAPARRGPGARAQHLELNTAAQQETQLRPVWRGVGGIFPIAPTTQPQ